jgi:hypothetical protein
VILSAGDQEQRRAIVVVEVDGGGGVRVEVGKGTLEQDQIRSGNGIAVVDLLRFLLGKVVPEGVMELLGGEGTGL